jgi:hypothetical protein
MPTIEKKRPAAEPRRVLQHPALVWSAIAICLVAVIVWALSLRRPPQMGANEEVFHTVDALFTAVTARDEKLLAQCEARLQAHRDGGQMPPESAEHLDSIIQKARGGSWQSAAERLYDFMRAQRREGAAEPPVRAKKPVKPKR